MRTTAEVPGSHAIYVSQPAAVADLITPAAQLKSVRGRRGARTLRTRLLGAR